MNKDLHYLLPNMLPELQPDYDEKFHFIFKREFMPEFECGSLGSREKEQF